jgi:hypothetical protein
MPPAAITPFPRPGIQSEALGSLAVGLQHAVILQILQQVAGHLLRRHGVGVQEHLQVPTRQPSAF